MVQCPCKDCEKKGCGPYHDKCEAYQNYVKANAEEKRKKKNDRLWDYSHKPSRFW